jgi:peptide chain release factor 1
MLEKVQQLLGKLQQIEGLLGLPEVLDDQKRYRQLTQEHAQLSALKEVVDRCRLIEKQLSENKKILEEETDPEMIALLREEIAALETELPVAQKEIENLLVPPDPRDSRNIIMELRAGTGGDEAAWF